MAGEAKNWDFFDKPAQDAHAADAARPAYEEDTSVTKAAGIEKWMQPDDPVYGLITETKALLDKMGLQRLNQEIQKVESSLQGKTFKVAVVGEFSKGKSTFINYLLEQDILPVGNLPTTALLTRLRYNASEMMVLMGRKGEKKAMPLNERSWEGLTAGINRADPQGTVFVGLKSEWLRKTGAEIIDTPGAGDLDEKRALLINDALLSADGAIITVSADKPLSLTERSFIEERLLFKKIPHLLLIVTKLDLIKPEERAEIVQYIKDKLEQWNINIPVFIPQDGLDVPGMDCSTFTGISSIKAEIERWMSNPAHREMKRAGVYAQLLSILDIARSAAAEKEKLQSLDKVKRDEVVENQKTQLGQIKLFWEDLKLEVMKRCNKCIEWLNSTVREKTEMVVERLQYEAMHAGNPQRWWQEDYPYRLKVELTSMAASLENGLSQIYANDVRWLNSVLEKQFKVSVFVDREVVAEKNLFKSVTPVTNIEFEDIMKQRTLTRVGTGAATVASYILLAGLGPIPIITSVVIGTGSAVITEKLFSGKIEKQRQIIKEALASDIPRAIDDALGISEKRLQESYTNIMKEASIQEELWVKTQLEAIKSAAAEADSRQADKLAELMNSFNALTQKIKDCIGG